MKHSSNNPHPGGEGRTITGETRECDDTSSPAEISECIERTRREMDETLQVVERKMAPSHLRDQASTYVRERYGSQMKWVQDLPRRIAAEPTPFVIIGAALMIGGMGIAGYAFSQQRRHTEKISTPKKIIEKGKQVWQERRRTARPKQQSEVYLRPVSGTFQDLADDQASTEELSQERFREDDFPRMEEYERQESTGEATSGLSIHEMEGRGEGPATAPGESESASVAYPMGEADIYGPRLGEEQVRAIQGEAVQGDQPQGVRADVTDFNWANKWMDHSVTDAAGEPIGTVVDIMPSMADSKLSYILIKTPADQVHPVPADRFETDIEGRSLKADFDASFFERSPQFEPGSIRGEGDWENDVRGYFGKPYK